MDVKEKFKKKLVRIIPFMLVGILTSSAIFFSYDKGNEVKAVAVADDILIVTALLALCGVTYLGEAKIWNAPGGWLEGADPDTDLQNWIDDYNKSFEKQWDEDVRAKALEKGLIDKNGNITGGGGSGGGSDDDNDNKFPTWEKLKTTIKAVSAKGGNIATALGAYLPFVGLFGYETLKESGATLADSLIDDGLKIDESYINSDTVGYAYGQPWKLTNSYADSVILYAEVPVCIISSGSEELNYFCFLRDKTEPVINEFKDGKFYGKNVVSSLHGYVTGYKNMYKEEIHGKLKVSCPVFKNDDDAYNYLCENNESNEKKYINPTTIAEDTNLKEKRKTGEGTIDFPTLPIYPDFLKLPSTSDLEDFFRNIGKDNENDDKDKKQKDIDDFIKKLTTNDTGKDPSTDPGKDPSTDPDKDPSTDPGKDPSTDPDKDPSTDPGKDPSTDPDNESFLTDLKELFPFCIPFDIVDCFKLFNAEPETPRVEFPIHFGIINKDYTFVIDLKDFNDVAGVCRSSFLTLFIVGLAFATSKVIKW